MAIEPCASNPCATGQVCRKLGINIHACEDVDECQLGTYICPQNSRCRNTFGDYECDCLSGFARSGATTPRSSACGNVNECSTGTHTCASQSACIDLDGSYMCRSCPNGFEGPLCNITTNACQREQCNSRGSCEGTVASPRCICDPGYEGQLCETDTNECLRAGICPTPPMNQCQNTVGSYTCTCGAAGCGAGVDCNRCNVNGMCVNTAGTMSCVCRPGYMGPLCEQDVDECLRGNACPTPPANQCQNTIGSFVCTCGVAGCGAGFDCNRCNVNGMCVNTGGRMSCSCDPGYMGPLCEQDINECLDVTVMCGNGSCVNTAGSFRCDCNDGYGGEMCDRPSGGSASAATGGGGFGTPIIAVIASAAVAVMLIAVFVFYKVKKRRQKKHPSEKDADKNEDQRKQSQVSVGSEFDVYYEYSD